MRSYKVFKENVGLDLFGSYYYYYGKLPWPGVCDSISIANAPKVIYD